MLECNTQFVESIRERLLSSCILGVSEWVPGMGTITFYYLPKVISYSNLCLCIKEMLRNPNEKGGKRKRKVVSLSVRYGGECGPDLKEVAARNKLTPDEVIRIHSANTYIVSVMGFVPGFPYLSGMSPKITMPRRANPRIRVHAGSVGIGDHLTGIYPISISGGWQIIGRTNENLFDIQNDPPFLLQIGDEVVFRPIE